MTMSKLVETFRPIKNSLHGSEVYNEKFPRSTKDKVLVPVDFLPSAQGVVVKSRTVIFRPMKSPENLIIIIIKIIISKSDYCSDEF